MHPIKSDAQKLAKGLSRYKDFVWLDSASTAPGTFSLMAWDPVETVVLRADDPPEAFAAFLRRAGTSQETGLGNWQFRGGWIGYLAYEALMFSPLVPQRLKQAIRARCLDEGNPELLHFCHYDRFIYFDHSNDRAFFVSTNDESFEVPQEGASSAFRVRDLSPVIDHARYAADFETIMNALRRGDYYELNYTQEFSGQFAGDALSLYLKLRNAAPAPMMAYLSFDKMKILSASPECFFRLAHGRLSTYPIKGTIKRLAGKEDEKQKAALLSDPKQRAELLMVTDMLRNDLGRVCRTGTVRMGCLARVETFSHYHHLVSEISGELHPAVSFADVMTAIFPGGSITGAPKIQVMEEICRLEKRRRGIYSGAIGLISNHGFAEFNIPIRTLTIAGNRLSFATGGGIVVDSQAAVEYDECLLKATGILEALCAKIPT